MGLEGDVRVLLIDLMTMIEVQGERLARIEARLAAPPLAVVPKAHDTKILERTCRECGQSFQTTVRRRKSGAFRVSRATLCRPCNSQRCRERLLRGIGRA